MMMLSAGAGAGGGGTIVVVANPRMRRHPPHPRMSGRSMTMCINNSDQLRAHLDQLHSEADKARIKANNARLRLMRLSEAAEKLRRQAAISVRTGKESEARDLLFQKKKIMQALENSKSRIELLDELAAKLNEAISIKETQLIGSVASDLEFGTETTSSPVRVVSPKPEVTGIPNQSVNFDANDLKLNEDDVLQICDESPENQASNNEPDDLEKSTSEDNWNGKGMFSSLQELSSYEEFLEHLDQQLSNMEAELVTVLRLSTLILESQEKPKNLKVQQTVEILECIRSLRKRKTVAQWQEHNMLVNIRMKQLPGCSTKFWQLLQSSEGFLL